MIRLVLIDGSNWFSRAFHVAPNLTTAAGKPVGAAVVFSEMLFRAITKTPEVKSASHLCVAWDVRGGANWRFSIDVGYKADRPAPDPVMASQFRLAEKACEVFGLSQSKAPGYEADDVIATYCRLFGEAFPESPVSILTSDKDLLALVDDRVNVIDTMQNKTYRRPDVIEKWGVPPELVGDLLAIAGDTVDGVIGAVGVGPKTAAAFLNARGSLEEVLTWAESTAKGGATKARAVDNAADRIRRNRRIVALNDAVPDLSVADLFPKTINMDALLNFLIADLESVKLRASVTETYGVSA